MTQESIDREATDSLRPGASAPLARVSNLTIRFPGAQQAAVDDVSFEIFPGQLVALVGESGSGKSLSARALLGLLPETASCSGSIEFGEDHAPPNGSPAWAAIRGRHAGLVPQDALGGLDPLRRIEHEVGDALRLHRIVPASDRRARVTEALANAGMPRPETQLHRRPDELSGGLRQRALVASALIADPELIIADEPTTALDAGHRARVLDEIRRRVDAGAGALLISHDLASVRGVADVVLVMRNGRVIERGHPRTVFEAPQHEFTRELLAASPAGRPRGERLLASHLAIGERSAGRIGGADAADAYPQHPEHPPRPPRIELEGITASFGPQRVLEDASLSVGAGETVGLVGESGSGKTTLLRIALGLHAPDEGRVLVDGVDRAESPRRARIAMRRRIALVPQDPLDTFPRGASGARILSDALRAAGTPGPLRRDRAVDLAREVDLDLEQLARPAATLSGGQRQRLAIARALARNPELLLLDEPVSALDITVQARVLDLLDDLQARHGTAYLLVSHDLDVIEHMSDRISRLDRGRIA